MNKGIIIRSAAVVCSALLGFVGAGSVASAQMAGANAETAQVAATRAAVGSPRFDATRTTTTTGPGAETFMGAFMQTLAQPRLAPVGTNDWTCKPSAEHPNPVILIHGTWENAYVNWSGMAPQLKKDGYCVFAPNLGRAHIWNKGGVGSLFPNTFGVAPVDVSAGQLAQVVDAVLGATGAKQVDLVGHSQGGVMARYYAKFGGGVDATDPKKNKIGKIITLGATNHGTQLGGKYPQKKGGNEPQAVEREQAAGEPRPHGAGAGSDKQASGAGSKAAGSDNRAFGTGSKAAGSDKQAFTDGYAEFRQWFGGVAGYQQEYGSEFIRKLNEGGETQPGVEYTIIGTKYDEISTPYDATFLSAGRGATVRNITMQDGCVEDHSDHMTMSYSPRGVDLVRHALDPKLVPADQIRCTGQGDVWGSS
ncbi:esterase/lipase family protein [Corynebacterium auriscanis]|uniref:esterase/lipase family protein n=1 Tax=Corynebacterium auriscanis TaxID=99807 RepID=UPI003CF34D1A